ncbi:MAG: hypothetical protein F4W99_05370 [Chloroflexi bacterium]|nr:hypothetical protein [Chloroflexota bacterium]MYJ01708.1 hypothetical protein [Chloroflexota bacterium]
MLPLNWANDNSIGVEYRRPTPARRRASFPVRSDWARFIEMFWGRRRLVAGRRYDHFLQRIAVIGCHWPLQMSR